jgi:hypothetical protein
MDDVIKKIKELILDHPTHKRVYIVKEIIRWLSRQKATHEIGHDCIKDGGEYKIKNIHIEEIDLSK